jgi:hypothetical protein
LHTCVHVGEKNIVVRLYHVLFVAAIRALAILFKIFAGKFQTEVGKAWALEIASRRRKER